MKLLVIGFLFEGLVYGGPIWESRGWDDASLTHSADRIFQNPNAKFDFVMKYDHHRSAPIDQDNQDSDKESASNVFGVENNHHRSAPIDQDNQDYQAAVTDKNDPSLVSSVTLLHPFSFDSHANLSTSGRTQKCENLKKLTNKIYNRFLIYLHNLFLISNVLVRVHL